MKKKKKVKIKYEKDEMPCVSCGGKMELMILSENNELNTDTIYCECRSCGLKHTHVSDDESRFELLAMSMYAMAPTLNKLIKDFLDKKDLKQENEM